MKMKLSDWFFCYILHILPQGYKIENIISEDGTKWFLLRTSEFTSTGYFSPWTEVQVRREAYRHYYKQKLSTL